MQIFVKTPQELPLVPLPLGVEMLRVTKPGGTIALNFRSRRALDALVLPLGALVRLLFRVPGIGPRHVGV